MNHPIRVLHIVGAMYPGGLENFIMNLYRHIDRTKVQFDFAVHARKPGDYGDVIEEMGGRIYELPRLTKNPVKSLSMLYRLVRENRYDVVIRHTANALVTPQLIAARMAGAWTVCHAHSVDDPMKKLHYAGRTLMPWAAKDRMACSEQAGKWMYGKLPFTVINNAIDINEFAYDAEAEKTVRAEFAAEDAHIYGHIGNLLPVKNHEYLLKVFRIIADEDPKALLICVGEGEMRSAIEQQIRDLQLEKRVILTGIRRDVPAILSAVDVLLFPSIFEGIPVTLIEAQAAALPCLVSDAVSRDITVTDRLVEFLSIQEEPSVWAEAAQRRMQEQYQGTECNPEDVDPKQMCPDNRHNAGSKSAEKASVRVMQREKIAQCGYDIDTLARWYEKYFADHRRK